MTELLTDIERLKGIRRDVQGCFIYYAIEEIEKMIAEKEAEVTKFESSPEASAGGSLATQGE